MTNSTFDPWIEGYLEYKLKVRRLAPMPFRNCPQGLGEAGTAILYNGLIIKSLHLYFCR